MRRKVMNATNILTLSWCAAFMIVMGTWLPPMIREPEQPEITLTLVQK